MVRSKAVLKLFLAVMYIVAAVYYMWSAIDELRDKPPAARRDLDL